MRSGKLEQAALELEGRLKEAPGDFDARCALAQVLSWQGEYAKSEELYQGILSKQPDHHDAIAGMARLRVYQSRLEQALALVERGLGSLPQDPELTGEKSRIEDLLSRRAYEARYRYTARAGFSNERYSFTGPGNSFGASLQDRAFHGWSLGTGASYLHRFALDDLDVGLDGSRHFSSGRAYAGFSLGGATRHVLLPMLRALLEGGIHAAEGVWLIGNANYRHYDNANIYGLFFSPVFSRWHLALTPSYAVSGAYYTHGGRSGWLSSYSVRLEWDGYRSFKPWLSYARTREAFEAGLAGSVSDFRADHYTFGLASRLLPPLELNASYSYEKRLLTGPRISFFGLGMAYSWGSLQG